MDKRYYDFLLIQVGSTQAEDIVAQGYDEYRDPRLEKNSETAEDLLRGRFQEDNELDDFVTHNLQEYEDKIVYFCTHLNEVKLARNKLKTFFQEKIKLKKSLVSRIEDKYLEIIKDYA